jgi:hypothetical protein
MTNEIAYERDRYTNENVQHVNMNSGRVAKFLQNRSTQYAHIGKTRSTRR